MTTAPPGGAGGTTAGCADESCSSFSNTLFQESSVELEKVVKIEEEVEDEEVAITADPREDVTRPMEGLGEAGPMPFLTKTYEMVSDPGTDPVVSWGSSGDSFVVWDEHEFSKQVLSRYFKHSNFSSFIRQLNTYGFRKINSDQLEFANEGFQRGKKDLLENIKRRRKFSEHRKISSSSVTSDYLMAGKETELKTLKEDQEALKAEILKLREERENLQHEINQVAKQIRYAECRHRRMFLFLSKASKSPNLVQHLTQERRQKRELETCESSKKSKLLGPDSKATKCLLEVMDHRIQSPYADCPRTSDGSVQMEFWPNNNVSEDFETFQMRDTWPPPMGGGDFGVVQGRTPNQMAKTSPSDLPSVFHEMLEKLHGENVTVGDNAEDVEVEELAMDDTGIYLELEGLIEKSCGWSEYTSELEEQAVQLTP